jgi:hypothetical protein
MQKTGFRVSVPDKKLSATPAGMTKPYCVQRQDKERQAAGLPFFIR